ncbi:MAG: T9SS type A sorting domain-containing protein, partial [Ignavibacteriaceae bacterium]|nr:T9SS type A sorting domain-containing protein [Ignavibacteriaceae bacterium]
TLKIYDMLGNEVAKLVDEFKEAGNYEVNFNASGLASGIYFYQLQIGDYTKTKKMILLR